MIAQLTRHPLDDVVVVPMRRRHLRAVLGIERRAYPRPWSPALFVAELERRDTRRYLVALAPRRGPGALGQLRPGREVVGYAGLILEPVPRGEPRTPEAVIQGGEAHVTTVAVDPRHHRRKLATRLLLALLTEARRAGAPAATLEVRVANRGAQRLYAAFGFVPVGVRPGYYAETGEDALVMWAHDLQGQEMAARLAVQAARLGEPGGASGAPDLHVPWVQGRIGLHDPSRDDGTAG
ncbi:MAG TPA: GNAT family N-acetyltransferase [Egibacteraceae bacterium]|nr:GNAT family N-acetyltransferase [Egibacteraceae bacterium]